MNSVCVFCGSNSGASPEFSGAARDLGVELARRKIRMVYGGSKLGLMGVLADACLDAGGEVIGVMPEYFIVREQAHPRLTRFCTVDDLSERKARMAELSDGFVALPGGLGTLDELFEVVSWTQLGMQHKPCGLLNVRGYYDKLAEFLDNAVAEQFVRAEHRRIVMLENSAVRLLEVMDEWMPETVRKW